MCVSDHWQDLGRLLTGSVLDVYGRIMGTYKDLKHRATQMLMVVAKGTEEDHYRFSQDNMTGQASRRIPGKEGLIRTRVGNECQGPPCRKAQETPTGHACPQASEHANGEAAQVPGSAGTLCIPCWQGHRSLGKRGERRTFSHTACWCGWIEARLYLRSCMYVNVSTASLWMDSLGLRC